MSSKLLPFPAVVELLGCSDGTLRSLDQELHPIRLRPRGKRFYRRDLIDDFLSQRAMAAEFGESQSASNLPE